MQWKIKIHPLAETELSNMPNDMKGRFIHIGELLDTFGIDKVGMPHIRPIENKLWEMRFSGRDGIGRAIYIAQNGRELLVLHAFIKKSQKTPRKNINIALSRIGNYEK